MLTINGNPITINGNFINRVIGGLPPYTLRLKFQDDFIPTFSKGTGVQISTYPNIWELTYENTDWTYLLQYQQRLLEVMSGNTSNVSSTNYTFFYCNSLSSISLFDTSNITTMASMFGECSALTTVPLFDTSNVTNMSEMFYDCRSLSSIPLFDTSKVRYMQGMFYYCRNVQYGALALYNQASTQVNPPMYHSKTFYNCGINRQTGSGELAQIPSNWK